MIMVRALAALVAMLALGLAAWSAVGAYLIESEYPAHGQFIEVDGLRLHYLERGSGPGIILMHGASSNLRDFESSLMPQLARDNRVIAFDRPGYGYSQRRRGDWMNPEQQAALMLKAARALGMERPLLVGHSWAGSIVMAALVHHPEQISGGVLLSGVAGHWAGSVGWTYDLANTPVIGPLFAYLLLYPLGQWQLQGAAATVLEPNPVPEGYVHRIGVPLALRAKNFLANATDMRELSPYLQSLSPKYRNIDRPLLAIHGDEDILVPFWNHAERLLPVLDQMQVLRLPGVGHAPHHSAPEQVASAIAEFRGQLADVEPAAPRAENTERVNQGQ